jgi:aminopeptidase N
MKRVLPCLLLLLLLGVSGCITKAPEPMPTPVSTQPVILEPTKAPPSQPPAAENWDDRSIFKVGLITEQQKVLEQLPGASVYHMDVHIADDLATLTGQERVRYTQRAAQPAENLCFQLFPNMAGGRSQITSAQVEGVEVKPVFESDNSAVCLPLAAPLKNGQSAVAQLDFKVDLPGSSGGNYGLFGYIDGILVLDGFYPAMPVFDEKGWHKGALPPNSDTTFQETSFYVVKVSAPASLVLVASGNEVERSKTDKNQVVTFANGPARDFYLAASDQFIRASQKVGQTTINSYTAKDMADGAKAALETAVKAFESYDKRLDVYPYTEFDVVSTPMQGAYGIEYPGIVGINYNLFDTKSNMNGIPTSVLLESTVAHEAGHQWFYNVVGNDQIHEPWMDEALDQYLTGTYFLDRYGQSGFEGYRENWVQRWERVGKQPIPIGLPAGDYQGREYGAIVYGRGPLFLEALAQKMGQAEFDKFFKDYYQTHEWGIGTADQFKQLAEKHCQCDLKPLFEEWVYKK